MAEVTERIWPVFQARRTFRIAAAVGAIGLAVTAIGIAVEPQRALLGYLAMYSAVTSTAIGVLVLLLIGHVANARWPAPLRRLHESVTIVFPALVVLFLPIALGLDHIYEWADPASELTGPARRMLEEKRAYLAPVPFVLRALLYLGAFTLTAELLRRWSRQRDTAAPADEPRTADLAHDPLRRERVFAAAMLPVVGLAVTFAGFDWVMSLQPLWYSSMFGVYYFAGGFVAGIAVVVFLAWRMRCGPTAMPLHGPLFHALGRMMLAFTVFWTYTAYFQGFLIQIADRPAEVTFYLTRLVHGWDVLLAFVVALRFVVPFGLLLPRSLKFQPWFMATVAGIIVVGHLLDSFWLVVPSRGAALGVSPFDLAALAGIAGACVALSAWRQRGVPIVPLGDPYLHDGLRYESPT